MKKFYQNIFNKLKKVRTSKAKGDELENRVVRLYKKRGEWFVKKDLTLRDNFGNISQIASFFLISKF